VSQEPAWLDEIGDPASSRGALLSGDRRCSLTHCCRARWLASAGGIGADTLVHTQGRVCRDSSVGSGAALGRATPADGWVPATEAQVRGLRTGFGGYEHDMSDHPQPGSNDADPEKQSTPAGVAGDLEEMAEETGASVETDEADEHRPR
jgi:hypothetical protein